jgi:hypothetical protein
MLYKDEEYIQLCELGEDSEIRFTQQWLDATRELGAATRTFAAHLITHWAPEFSRMLDYFGPDDAEVDTFTGVNGDPMDVREDIPYTWEYIELPFSGLTCEWYRDIMRCKLVSLKVPARLIKQYIKAYKGLEKG